MSQMEFSDWPGEKDPDPVSSAKEDLPLSPAFEKTDCQYCEDVGLCTYCRRGKEAISEFEKEAKITKKKTKLQKKKAA